MADPVATAFAEVLSDARKRSGMSQEDLAHLAGIDRTTVSAAERGESSPRLATLIRLAGALGVDPCSLLPSIRWTPPRDEPRPMGRFESP